MREPVKKTKKPTMRTTHRTAESKRDLETLLKRDKDVVRLTRECAQLREALERARLRIVAEVNQREHYQRECEKLKGKP